MSDLKLAQFQVAAVQHIVSRLTDASGSRRMLLADEVGLGKTVVAKGVIQELLKRRRNPLTVIYLCSNAEIAEQNRVKLDPDSRRPLGRVTELAIDRHDASARLLLYSFTPGTSLKEGTGLAWERRLLMYLFHRLYGSPVATKAWREFFRCGAGEDNWHRQTSLAALAGEFERKTTSSFQQELATAWRGAKSGSRLLVPSVRELVSVFDPTDATARSLRNQLISSLRGVMQRVALRHLQPHLVILDEVQRFRDVLDESQNPEHIAAELFAKRVPVLILSATPYRALTLAHEVGDKQASHHEDFFRTLDFLFDNDTRTPSVLRNRLREFGERLKAPNLGDALDPELLRLKRAIEGDLTKVICRTERNWYVVDRRKGVDDSENDSGILPGREELKEYFTLHRALAATSAVGQVTEFWKSAPSLLTFLDAQYHVIRSLKNAKARVPRQLLTPAGEVASLEKRNHRISKVIGLTLGHDDAPPRLWTAPTYSYYRDEYFGVAKPRKLLVFSGWRFVPKTVAIVTSKVATERLGGEMEDVTLPLRFTEKGGFHVFDVCFPSPALAEIGHEALITSRQKGACRSVDVLDRADRVLRKRLKQAGIQVVEAGGHRPWQVAMRLEENQNRRGPILEALEQCIDEQEDGAADHLRRHADQIEEWLSRSRTRLQISEAWVKRLALVAVFSPGCAVLRACQSVYGEEATMEAFSSVAILGLGPMRNYFNRPHVQQVIRNHRFRLPWRQMPSEERGYAERTLIYSADAHLQAVLDEYVYLLRHASQAETVERALQQLGDVWTLARGNPRTNRARGNGDQVQVEENAETHSTHFALAFGEDVSRDSSADGDDDKLRKSVVREAFNSPFWPFVLATTSVGQEGLDFHLYCRDVLHWNLPSNPVDLEQREGRINRRDCLAVRESIAQDWPLEAVGTDGNRNPWASVFDAVLGNDDVQKYKHGLFPHWVYECKNADATVRIKRHVPFFSTSRDSARYEGLKIGLALYRLVFGQVNQEDLLEKLKKQTEGLDPESRERRFKRLASYMLNLSPISHEAALRFAREEADAILRSEQDDQLRSLINDVSQLQNDRPEELAGVKKELRGLIDLLQRSLDSKARWSAANRKAATALTYLRNPYDHIFDLAVEVGFADDIEVIRNTWAELRP